MEKNKYLKRLEKSGIKPTALWLLVLEAIANPFGLVSRSSASNKKLTPNESPRQLCIEVVRFP